MMMMTNEGEGKDYDGNEIIQIKGTGHNIGEICWLSVKIYPKTEITTIWGTAEESWYRKANWALIQFFEC